MSAFILSVCDFKEKFRIALYILLFLLLIPFLPIIPFLYISYLAFYGKFGVVKNFKELSQSL